MKYLKIGYYGLYMIWFRLKGIKRDFIHKFKGEKEAWKYGQKAFEKWTMFTIKIVGMDISVEGKDNIPEETCVFMGNHQSILDIPTLRYATDRPLDFVAKKELKKVPVLGYWMTHLKSVALDRENAREGMKAINLAINNIKDGYTFVVFPEGSRSNDGTIGEFKKGSTKLVTKTRVPVVPFAIDGTSKCFEDTKEFIPGKIKISFGKPIYMDDISKEEEKMLASKIRDEVCELYR